MDINIKETKKLSVGNNGIYVYDTNVDENLVEILVDLEHKNEEPIIVNKNDLVGIVEVINTYLEEDKKIR